jgi:biotin carboxylase
MEWLTERKRNVTTKIWINRARTYKTHLIDMLRSNPDGRPVEIYTTHVEASPATARADHYSAEPSRETPDEEYAAWALEFAERNGIDFLLPSDRVVALSHYQHEFARIGTTLLSAPNPDRAAVTNSKTETYRLAAEAGLRVPLHVQVSTAADFRDAVRKIEWQGFPACVKPDTGWAADGFWLINHRRPSASELFTRGQRTVRAEDYARALHDLEDGGEKIPPLIVMPYMDDPETSIDCLTASDGQVVTTIARSKGRYARTFSDDPAVHHIARTMAQALGITYLSNVQTRMLDGEPMLLEVNPRASDGLPHCMATGINLAWEAVRLASGEPVRALRPDTSKLLYVVDSIIEL